MASEEKSSSVPRLSRVLRHIFTVQFALESVSTLPWNDCPVCRGIGVQVGVEYASFSYGRALQAPVLAAWQGQESNAAAAQKALLTRCHLNGLARDGQYARTMEGAY